MPGVRRATALRLAGLAISAVSIVIIAKSVDLGATAAVIGKARLEPLLLVAAALVVQLLLRGYRWRMLLPVDEGSNRPTLTRVLTVLPIGYLGNVVFPARLGEPIRAYLLARREGLDPLAVFGSVVLERIIDTATLAVVGLLAALVVGGPAWLLQATAIVAGVCIGALVVIVIVMTRNPASAQRLVAAARRRPQVRIALDALAGFTTGLGASRHPDRLLLAALISGTCWILDGSIFWLVSQSLGIDLSIQATTLIAAVTVLGTALPSAPGYIGTFELAAATVAGILGVAPASALALAVLAHAVAVLPIAIVGAVALFAVGGSLGSLAQRAEAPAAQRAEAPR
jgi:uncharacterized protein (TIRG00374 family)